MAQMHQLSFEDQVDNLVKLLQAIPAARATPKAYGEFMSFAVGIPPKFFPQTFTADIARVFNEKVEDVNKVLLSGQGTIIPDFDTLVPRHGWLKMHVEWTRKTEPPTVYHFFAAMCVLGAVAGRRVKFPRGSGDLYPNLNVVLVSPPGKCKKTTACNLAVKHYQTIGMNLMADKVTPEAIVGALQPTAQGLIYAPEWAVFLGKQQYNEGLVPMLTALFDCPDVWESRTIARGVVQLKDVALSHLACTTIDWMQTSITKDAFAGGFMSRLIFVVQHDSPRKFALPPPKDPAIAQKLVDHLLKLQHVTGDFSLAKDAEDWYVHWYENRTSAILDKQFAGYFERKPDRLLQIAMLLTLSESLTSLVITKAILEHAEKILLWIEHWLPSAFAEMSGTLAGDEQGRILRQLRQHKELNYSDWLRMNTGRLETQLFKKYVETLKQAKLIAVDHTRHRYYILPAGEAVI